MSAVFRKVEMEWAGKTWDVTPGMELVNDVEQRFCTWTMFRRIFHQKERCMGPMAQLAAAALKLAGCREVTQGEVWAVMRKEVGHGAALYGSALDVLLSIVVAEGNSEAPATGAVSQSPAPSDGPSSTRSQSDTSASSRASSGG